MSTARRLSPIGSWKEFPAVNRSSAGQALNRHRRAGEMAQKRRPEAEGNSTSMSSASSAALGPVFQLNDLVRVMRERSGLIRTVAIATVALAAAVVTILPTLYSTSASVMLDQRKNNVAD